MGFSYDINNKLKQSRMFLANPQKKYVGTISGAENVKLTLKFNSLNELSFTIYEYKNNEATEFYDKIIKMRLIELQYIGWFQIQNVVEKQDENSKEPYKEVKCYSLENELIYKKVFDINGVFSLYDVQNPSKSILHIVAEASGYQIGHIDNSLLGKYRTFNIDTEQVYSLLTTTVSKSFECVFDFDTYSRSINCYELANMGELTDIVISRKNILNEHIKDDGDENIITKLRIYGGDGIDVRSVNPSGSNYIICLDYFMSTDWGFSQSTIDAWNSYKLKTESVSANYSSTLSLLKTKQSELLTLNTQLTNLQALLKSQESVKGSCMDFFTPRRVPYPSDSNYTIYQDAVNLINTYTTQIANKEDEITAKESEIATVNTTLNNIGAELDWSSNFTSEQIAEINVFLTEDQDYTDSTFTTNSVMSKMDIIDMTLELLHNANNELIRASQPQFTYSTTSNNIFTICDNKDDLIPYSLWREKFKIGNLISIKFNNNYTVTVRLMEMTIDFDEPEQIDLVFSDKSRLDDALIQLGEVISASGKAATSYSLNKFGYDSASSISNEVREFINGNLNATTNRVFSDKHIQTELSEYGIINRKWLEDQKKYDDRQSLLTQNVLLFTDDGWKSSEAGFGYYTNPNGETFYGILTPVICGDFVISSKLRVVNSSGTYSITDTSGFQASNTINGTLYSVGINPSTPNEIFNIKVNNISQLYINTVSKKLVYKGDLEAAGGSFSGAITGGTLNINNKFMVDAYGNCTANALTANGSTFTDGHFSGAITASTISIGNGTFVVNVDGSFTATKANISGNITSSTIDSSLIRTANDSGTSKTEIFRGLITSNILQLHPVNNGSFSSYGMTLSYGGIRIENSYGSTMFSVDNGNVICSKINGGTPITTSNMPESSDIIAVFTSSDTSESPIDIGGTSNNIASVGWCNSKFEVITSSDFRLKKNIKSLDEIPLELFLQIKMKQYEFKIDDYGRGINFGALAQEIESLFISFGLNPYDYNLIELASIRSFTDEGMYVTDQVHRINYQNLFSLGICATQKMYKLINDQNSIIVEQNKIISDLTNRIGQVESKLYANIG